MVVANPGRKDRAGALILGVFGVLGGWGAACSSGRAKSADAGAPGGNGGGTAGVSDGSTAGGGGAGASGAGGGSGAHPADACTFTVAHASSTAIGTVEIVNWTLDVTDLTEAHIDFGPAGAAPTMTAPVDLGDPTHRTLLLGLKGQKPYVFRVAARSAATACTSADFSFTTGAVPATAPKIAKTMQGAGAARGFIVTTTGVDNLSHSTGQPDAYIFDTDGDIVWWSSSALYGAANGISRAHMSWDGKAMWIETTSSAKIVSISMDGLTTTDYSNVVKGAHHDFAPLPEGGIATMLGSAASTPNSIVEVKPDATVVLIADLSTLYQANPAFSPNAIHYYPADDSFTLSDHATGTNLFVKFERNGTLVWQLGGTHPLGKSFQLIGLSQWQNNHGHHLTPDGRFLFFNNVSGQPPDGNVPRAIEVQLDETNGTATKTWEYAFSMTATALGDVERLPNGNALVTNSIVGVMQEVDRSGTIIQSFSNTTFGYVDFRTSLYGPPPR